MSDILWRNDNGALGIWELNGNNVIATLELGTVSADRHIADTADVNGDDTSDNLWHNDNGATGVWEFKDGNVIATLSVGTLSPDWDIMT
jgi:hypothetical protein